MLLSAVVAAVCLCLPVHGLAGTEQKSNEFLFLLDKIGQLEKQMSSMENRLQKDVNVHLDLSEVERCQAGKVEMVGAYAPRKVNFGKAFSRTPVISYGIIHLDTDHTRNTRVTCSVGEVTLTGFTLTCSQWNDSVLYGISVSWIAC